MSLFGSKDDGSSGLVGNSKGGGGLENLKNWSQTQWENITGKSKREAAKRAAKEAERLRRESIVQQMKTREQADQLAYGAAMANSMAKNSSGNKAPGMVGTTDGEGTLGAALSSAGTF